MLTPAWINIQTFFYPVGNTPAISLTQSLPPGDPANVLLLGCGDVRHILFTTHNDSRKLDITCCDNQKAVIARNVLLLSLIVDDTDGRNSNRLWNIYYHLYLDRESLDLLRSQSKTLLDSSASLESWEQSKYGSCLRFCDSATLADVRKMWDDYSTEHKGTELARVKRHFESIIDRANVFKRKRTGSANTNQRQSVITGLRSASPAAIGSLEDLDALHEHFWKYGTTDLKTDLMSVATHPNPAFLTVNDGAAVHYGTDPLLGFHLAAVNAPLDSTESAIDQLPRLERYAAVARAEFCEWTASYRKLSRESGIKVRFFIGDAVAFAHTLQHKRLTSENTAHWYRDRYGVRPLVLDGRDYASDAKAPTVFDVIDTSNLCDHLGSLTLMVATSPLLRDHASAVLYTEVLSGNHKSCREVLDQVLCGDTPTISALLDLFPIEFWTNTSSYSIADEQLPGSLLDNQASDGKSNASPRQMFLRTSWKRPLCMRSINTPLNRSVAIHFDPKELATTLYAVFVQMFRDEDWVYKMSNMGLLVHSDLKSGLAWYQRPSFVSFLRLVQTRVTCDWDAVMNSTMDLIENRRDAPMGMNYYQELNIYLHMLGVFSTDILREWHKHDKDPTPTPFVSRTAPVPKGGGDLREWTNIPSVVCVTLNIPRKKLAVFTDMKLTELGTPPVHCYMQSADICGTDRWQNIFPACQLSFGKISTRGAPCDDSYEVCVQEDESGWAGESPLIASFFSPAFPLLRRPRDISVAFGLHHSPSSVARFTPKLGPVLDVYQTTLEDSDAVYVTRLPPNQKGYPIVTGFAQVPPQPSQIKTEGEPSLTVAIDPGKGTMSTLTSRLDITSSQLKAVLTSGCEVTKSITAPCEVAVSLGPAHTLGLCFPVFVKDGAQKLRIARKSSYVEVVAQVADASDWRTYPHSMYPIHCQVGEKPVNCNMPYLNLQKCPVIDLAKPDKLGWLTAHLAMAMSAREWTLRENARLPRLTGEQIRLDLKDSIYSILIGFTGLQGDKSRVVCLNNVGNGGVHVVIFASALRMNLANRAVVLDCAILPLHDALMPEIMNSLGHMLKGHTVSVKVDDAELRLWRYVLPSYVERCRDWAHREDCEYSASGRIPLNVDNGEPLLCTCGTGKFPPGFITDVPGWDTLSKYAVRAAISPPFWAPFADDMYCPSSSDMGKQTAEGDGRNDQMKASTESGGCASCGKTEQANGGGLMSCARCRKVRYCSRGCQRTNWKTHKAVCA